MRIVYMGTPEIARVCLERIDRDGHDIAVNGGEEILAGLLILNHLQDNDLQILLLFGVLCLGEGKIVDAVHIGFIQHQQLEVVALVVADGNDVVAIFAHGKSPSGYTYADFLITSL